MTYLYLSFFLINLRQCWFARIHLLARRSTVRCKSVQRLCCNVCEICVFGGGKGGGIYTRIEPTRKYNTKPLLLSSSVI